MIKTVEGRLIPPKQINETGKLLGKHVFESLDTLPIDVPEDRQIIVSNWNSNIYLETLKDNQFIIKEVLGEPLKLNTEYLIIQPKY